jgi:hypothetical protein
MKTIKAMTIFPNLLFGLPNPYIFLKGIYMQTLQKYVLVLLCLGTSVSAFANLDDCQSVMGTYECTYEGSAMELVLTKVDDTSFSFALMGQGTTYQVDGQAHKSKTDDSMEVGNCSKTTGISISSTFKEEVQTNSFAPTAQGIEYKLVKPEGTISLPCVRK